jgi:hypothetical protein
MSGCWLWTASLSRQGYGQFYTGTKGRFDLAHRVSYVLNVGEIPAGKELDHLCYNPSCINPQHLEAVTRAENIKRGWIVRRRLGTAYQKQICKRGHPYSGDNLYLWTDPQTGDQKRMCRKCHAIRAKAQWQKRN